MTNVTLPHALSTPSEILADFGLMLREERERRSLTVNDISRRAGVSRAIVEEWEEGRTMPTSQQWKRLRGTLRRLIPSARLREYMGLGSDAPSTIVAGGAYAAFSGQHLRELVEATAEPETVGDPEPPATFGEALRRAREDERIEQRALGELIGVTQSTISSWERDAIVPVMAHYERLLDLLPQLIGAPQPPSRDISPPPGPAGWTFPAPPPRGPDVDDRATPVRAPVEEPAVELSAPPPAAEVVEEVEASPLPPDGLELLAAAVRVARTIYGSPYVATVREADEGEGWIVELDMPEMSLEPGATRQVGPTAHGDGKTARLALGVVLGCLHEDIDRKRDELERELERKRRELDELAMIIGGRPRARAD